MKTRGKGDATVPYADRIFANLAGHDHLNLAQAPADLPYEIHVTDATFDDQNAVRPVRVRDDGATYSYEVPVVNLP